MATWCPHCHHLKQLLNDREARPYVAGQKLVFLFGDEREDAKAQETAGNGLAAVMQGPNAEGGASLVDDAAFFADLPGDHYFCTLPSKVTGFPMVLSATQGYSFNWGEWLVSERKMPVELANKLADHYDPIKPKK